MARDNSNSTPAYSPPEADQTGERTAVNEGDGTVTEPQADQAQQGDGATQAHADTNADKGTTKESGTDRAAQEEAARKQAEEDTQARYEAEANGTFVHREANPDVGGESFPSFAPPKK